MSEPHHSHSEHDDAPHEGPIKNVKQLIWAVFFAFVIPIAVIVLLVTNVSTDTKEGTGSDGMTVEDVARKRMKQASDIKSYENFLHETAFRLPGVTHVRSSVVLKEVKAETRLPLEAPTAQVRRRRGI